MEINMTKMSSKGQIVIPLEMRKDLKVGDKLIIIKNNDQIIIKRTEDFNEQVKEDLEFAKKTEKAYCRHEKGDFIEMSSEDFLNKIKEW